MILTETVVLFRCGHSQTVNVDTVVPSVINPINNEKDSYNRVLNAVSPSCDMCAAIQLLQLLNYVVDQSKALAEGSRRER